MRYSPEVKKSPPHLLQKFAVCDIPLYTICDYNVSRDRCKELGCCFYKSVCYEKAVPVYVHAFSILVTIIAVTFIIATVYKIVRERRKQKEILTEPSNEASSEAAVTSRDGQLTSQLSSGTASKKSDENTEEEELAVTELEDMED